MKVLFSNSDYLVVYCQDFYAKELELSNRNTLATYFKSIFQKLKDHYHIQLSGYYDIMLYHDINYGAVIEITKEENDYYDMYINTIDMKIQIEKESSFLYELEDPFEIDSQLLQDSKLYRYHGKLYLQLIEKIDYIDLGKLLEHSNLIYQYTEKILKSGTLVEL